MPESDDRITLAHGSGGTFTRSLIEKVILPCFDNPVLKRLEDAAVLETGPRRTAFTTDSYIVKPLFYPGGDIGRLSVYGTINDLAVTGARPLMISVSLVIEEGLPMKTLKKILASMGEAAKETGVPVVTGDTKVVEKGYADGLYVTTSGVGSVEAEPRPSVGEIRPGDAVILTGTVGDHGAAVMLARGEFELKAEIKSDNAPLADMILNLVKNSKGIRFMRDPTRGGLAATLNEIAGSAGLEITVEEPAIPVKEAVRSFCEILGLDPLYVANEGKAVIVAAGENAGSVLEQLRAHPLGQEAAKIGEIGDRNGMGVMLKTAAGGERILDMPSGLLLPRIC